MNKHRILSLFICFLLLIGSAQACKSKESVLIQNTACQFPCWQNIRPGRTTSNEAIQILLKLTFLESEPSIAPILANETRSYNSWTFQDNIREMGGYIVFINNIVAYIEFTYTDKIKINDFTNYYGEPEYVSVMTGQADTQWLQISWIYPRKGVLIIHFTPYWHPTPPDVNIMPNLSVSDVYYFDPNLYDNLLEEMFRNGIDLITIEQSMQIWKGYGIYSYTEIK